MLKYTIMKAALPMASSLLRRVPLRPVRISPTASTLTSPRETSFLTGPRSNQSVVALSQASNFLRPPPNHVMSDNYRLHSGAVNPKNPTGQV